MSSLTGEAAAEVHPAPVEVPDDQLEDLRRRLRHVRFPEPETVAARADGPDWSQGVPRAYLEELCRYWREQYDWRRVQAEFNRLGPSRTVIDGLGLHLLHARSGRADARPLILTHGWPGSVVECLDVIDGLVCPPSDDLPAFHVVAPSLPGFGFSDRPDTTGWGIERIADAWAELMTRLGYDRFLAQGGDWGGAITAELAVRHPDRVEALHTTTPWSGLGGQGGWTRVTEAMDHLAVSHHEAHWLADTREFWRSGAGYSAVQSTRPQTLGYGLVDSPAGQLAWIVEKFQAWTDCAGHPENAVARDRILDDVTLYWLTGSGASSARIYWENSPADRTGEVTVPAAVSVFPKDIEKVPRSWVETRFTDLRYYNVLDHGGHFPTLEVPARYLQEVRAAFG